MSGNNRPVELRRMPSASDGKATRRNVHIVFLFVLSNLLQVLNRRRLCLFDSKSAAGRCSSHKEGDNNLVQLCIDRDDGHLGDKPMSKHEDLRAVAVSDLDDIVWLALAKRIREQIDADEANLRSGDYLVPHVKGTQASKDRKKKRRESAASALFTHGGGG